MKLDQHHTSQKAEIILRGQPHHVPAGHSLQHALEGLGIPPELYLAIRNGDLLDVREILRPGDQVRLVGVISGG